MRRIGYDEGHYPLGSKARQRPLTRAFGATSPRMRGEVNKANAPPPLLFDGRGAARVSFSVLERMERREAPGVCETPLTELARLRCRARADKLAQSAQT